MCLATPNSRTYSSFRPLTDLAGAQQLAYSWGLRRVGGQTLTFGGDASHRVELTAVAWGDGVAVWWADASRVTRPSLRQWLRRAESATGVRAVLCAPGAGRCTVATFAPGTSELVARSFDPGRPADQQSLIAAGAMAEGNGELLLVELEELLGRRPLGRQFVADFRKGWRRWASGWTGIAADAEDDRRELALAVLSRLLFLAFVQARGWLAGRPHFLAEECARARDAGASIYRTVLRPLFFEVLNTPVADRTEGARRLGRIPYLNGGLFCADRLEQDHPDLDVPNDVVQAVFDGVFHNYVFSGSEAELESRFAQQEHAGVIDPEMLGQVFESLMASDKRGQSGSYYTPHHVVARIVRDALVAHAAEVLERYANRSFTPTLSNGRLRQALIAVFERGEVERLSVQEAEVLDRVLARVRILDPAAGSGAFLIGAFEVLVATRISLGNYIGMPHDPDAVRRHTATHNLFGVDLLPSAIRLCELRLWLALSWGLQATDIEDIPPLPNLDLSLRQGNSLLEQRDVDSVLATAQGALDPGVVRRLGLAKAAYLDATGTEKARLRAHIAAAEHEALTQILGDGVARLDRRLVALDRLEEAPNLFGHQRGLRAEERKLRQELQGRKDNLLNVVRGLDAQETPFFSFGLHFAEVLREGGFDLVIGNPPWVRPHRQTTELKARIRSRYLSCHRSAWATGARLGGGLKAGQVDLAAVFVERALQLVAPGGVVGLLVPSKLFGSLSTGGMRRVVGHRAQILGLVDWSQSSEQMFGATTYPALMLLRRRRGEEVQGSVHIETRSGQGKSQSFRTSEGYLSLVPGDTASPWILVPPPIRQQLEVMQASGPPLGALYDLRRGVVTGRNKVFIPEAVIGVPGADTVDARFKGDRISQIEKGALYPLLRGSDITAWRASPGATIVYPHGQDSEPLSALPPGLAEHFDHFRDALLARTDLRANMVPWTLFRVHPQLLRPRVVWRDIAGTLEAAFVPATVDSHPLLGRKASVPLNTVYYIPVDTDEQGYLLAAVLNSKPAREFVGALAEHARGNYRRFFAWVVGMLPWPMDGASPEVSARLIQLSQALHGHLPATERGTMLQEVDALCARAFGVDHGH